MNYDSDPTLCPAPVYAETSPEARRLHYTACVLLSPPPTGQNPKYLARQSAQFIISGLRVETLGKEQE